MSAITTYLTQIMDEAHKLGVDIEGNMYPGASIEEIKKATRALPFDLPEDIVELYLWRNGVRLKGQSCEFRIFPRLLFQSINVSVETTRILISSSDEPLVRWRKTWYSLATDLAGDYYALDATRDGQARGRIFAVMEATDPYPAFWSFEAMLLSVLECYRMGTYFLDESGFLGEDREMSDTIYRAINRGLSPHRLESRQDLIDQVKRAKGRFENEGRPDLIQKLRELARNSRLNIDKL
jgi:cell wall assembly regulator SMI1